MKKLTIILISLLISGFSTAKEDKKWYGVFTGSSYPVDGCRIVKARELISTQYAGHAQQNKKENDYSYTKIITDNIYSNYLSLALQSQKEGYNALIGYKVDVYGGFSGYGGKTVNGGVGFGAFIINSMGNPVLIKCNK
ncbi:hypothetical protein [uncultured Gammaproteobacteria bacterium]|nr:hypothetical protein [uncultured Gammaproteobacteria bacterium]